MAVRGWLLVHHILHRPKAHDGSDNIWIPRMNSFQVNDQRRLLCLICSGELEGACSSKEC